MFDTYFYDSESDVQIIEYSEHPLTSREVFTKDCVFYYRSIPNSISYETRFYKFYKIQSDKGYSLMMNDVLIHSNYVLLSFHQTDMKVFN